MILARQRNRVFVVAFIVSTLIHLSTVTVFRIVLYFPHFDMDYVNVEIVREGRLLSNWEGQLSVPDPGDAFARLDLDEPLHPVWNAPPPIELPKIQFAEMGRLRMKMQGLEVRSRYDELFADEPVDSWARFGQTLSNVGDVLASVVQGESTTAPELMSRPAPGYEARIEWLSEPKDREALSVEKIEALWGRDPSTLQGPITLSFKVDRDGNVVDVISPVEDDADLIEGAIDAIRGYRFEPVGEDVDTIQIGTLVIRATGETP